MLGLADFQFISPTPRAAIAAATSPHRLDNLDMLGLADFRFVSPTPCAAAASPHRLKNLDMLGLADFRFALLPPHAAAAFIEGNTSIGDGNHCTVPLPEDTDTNKARMETMNGAYKWRMVIAYDGTKFKGWQYQPSPPTIQCCIENALTCFTKLDRKELSLVGAGRTDTVHNDRVRSPIKKIMCFNVIEMDAILQLEVEGTGFLYRQVRNMGSKRGKDDTISRNFTSLSRAKSLW
ncbi:hypothetical protein E2562_027663 [Oryza meyeriana var. granulata]|uniref:tRNA pseudouridine synthase n=1 Tax=Oryza meyeriana var. granulata TaxID=110450 RepID=A0A6G1E3N9_9ORYZ|nr:hypothetical protein E2562_027663 [Oryza meyeriana var. granulata]